MAERRINPKFIQQNPSFHDNVPEITCFNEAEAICGVSKFQDAEHPFLAVNVQRYEVNEVVVLHNIAELLAESLVLSQHWMILKRARGKRWSRALRPLSVHGKAYVE